MKKVTLFTVAAMMMCMFVFTSVGFAGQFNDEMKKVGRALKRDVNTAFCEVFPKNKRCRKPPTKAFTKEEYCKTKPKAPFCKKSLGERNPKKPPSCKRNPKASFCKSKKSREI